MGCSPAPACHAALDEATRRWSNRSRSSDGICGDASHQTRPSDHNVGEAFDLTHDPAHGVDSYAIADWLRERVLSGAEKRVKYIISNRRIFNPSISDAWRRYTGSNPHDHHCHVSLLGAPHASESVRNDVRSWWNGYGQQEDDLTPAQAQQLDDTHKIALAALEGVKALTDAILGADGDFGTGLTVFKLLIEEKDGKFLDGQKLTRSEIAEIRKLLEPKPAPGG